MSSGWGCIVCLQVYLQGGVSAGRCMCVYILCTGVCSVACWAAVLQDHFRHVDRAEATEVRFRERRSSVSNPSRCDKPPGKLLWNSLGPSPGSRTASPADRTGPDSDQSGPLSAQGSKRAGHLPTPLDEETCRGRSDPRRGDVLDALGSKAAKKNPFEREMEPVPLCREVRRTQELYSAPLLHDSCWLRPALLLRFDPTAVWVNALRFCCGFLLCSWGSSVGFIYFHIFNGDLYKLQKSPVFSCPFRHSEPESYFSSSVDP